MFLKVFDGAESISTIKKLFKHSNNQIFFFSSEKILAKKLLKKSRPFWHLQGPS